MTQEERLAELQTKLADVFGCTTRFLNDVFEYEQSHGTATTEQKVEMAEKVLRQGGRGVAGHMYEVNRRGAAQKGPINLGGGAFHALRPARTRAATVVSLSQMQDFDPSPNFAPGLTQQGVGLATSRSVPFMAFSFLGRKAPRQRVVAS